MKPVIVIADDLTGAADTGVCFRRAGLSVQIVFSTGQEPCADVLVYSSESRHAGEVEARSKVRRLLPAAQEAAFIYKKIDSTLRGSPGAELAEIMSGLGLEKALVAPAFPAQGRTTLDGKQLIHGQPIEGSSFPGEAAGSDLKAAFQACQRAMLSVSLNALRDNPDAVLEIFSKPGPAVILGDAESEGDLRVLADAALQSGLRLFCGSAGLAAALADRLRQKGFSQEALPFRGQKGPILVIAGSRNGVSVGQVETARNAGVRVFELDPDLGPTPDPPTREVLAASRALDLGQDAVLTTSNSFNSCLGEAGVAERLGQWARILVDRHAIGGLVLTGGDVAMAVISALSADGIRLESELLPGIPLGILVGGARPDLPVITKAGGFGSPGTLVQAIQFLRAAGAEPFAAPEA